MAGIDSDDDLPVLIVDDDPIVRRLLTLGLRKAGLEVVEAGSGRAALEILDRQTVGVVVCDLGMPGMNGIDVVVALRGRPETATLPFILVTGSGDDQSVVAGLEAGADDFLPKPVRLDELVARVRAHMRTQSAWSNLLQDELGVRSGVVAALGSMKLSALPEESAEAVVREIARRTDTDFISVAQITLDSHMQELATYNKADGVQRGGASFGEDLAAYLLGRVRAGPWVDDVRPDGPAEPTAALRNADLDMVASAPVFAADDLVGMLSIGAVADDRRSRRSREARLLAAAIDYASVLSAIAGSSIAGQREASARRADLKAMLDAQAFHPVFQRVVDIDTRSTVGFEALTRFDDDLRPDLRFAEAARADLGAEFELAAIRIALEEARSLPPDVFLSLNISPATVIARAADVSDLLLTSDRPIVIELTEHVMIEDYESLISALRRLGDIQVAVDDAGAGFASMRHILELQPSFAKLDISLVRDIDSDDLRQGMAAGLNYYALRTGCRLIAEGVETEPEADALRRLGVELGQGYLYGRPGPAAEQAAG